MCGCNKSKERWVVTLATGMKFFKSTEAQAKTFAAKHEGATYAKVK